NRSGNLMRVESIIALAGISVGGVEKMAARDEKQKDPNSIADRNVSGYKTFAPRFRPMMSGTSEKTMPNMKEARMSPNIIVETDTGQDMSLSRVFDLVSQGMTIGVTAVDVKKTVTTVRFDIKKLTSRSLPIRKAANMKVGNSIPITITGAFR
ncbi:MAG: hypothetical protein QXI59_05920, partial [Candidatus Bathyarchaeia archaeon]